MKATTDRILIVDNDPASNAEYRELLQEQGLEVFSAPCPVTAAKIIQEQPNFSAVILNLSFPGEDGLQLIDSILAKDEETLIVATTLHPHIKTAEVAAKIGAYQYLPKPFSPEELLIVLAKGLECRRLAHESRKVIQKQEEQLMELAFERYKSRAILNCITDGVIVINRQKQILLCNSPAARIIPELSSLTPPALLGEVIADSQIHELCNEIFEAEGTQIIKTREIFLDNGFYMVNAAPIYNHNRENLGVVIVLKDITALKKLNLTKAMFVTMVARELHGPLESIEECVKKLDIFAAVDFVAPKCDPCFQESLVKISTMKKMLAELISLTEIETGQFTMKRCHLDIRDVLQEVIKAAEEAAGPRQIKIHFHPGDGVDRYMVLADRNALSIIFKNLLENAVNYNRPGGRIDVTVEDGGMFLTIAVADNGIGMSEEEVQRAFDDFYRANNKYTVNIPGTGLGLSLVKRLIELHQGRVSLRSSPGEGSTFKVRLLKE